MFTSIRRVAVTAIAALSATAAVFAAAPAANATPAVTGPWVGIITDVPLLDNTGWAYATLPAPGVAVYQTLRNGGSEGCTISFPVVDSSNRIGFLTAGHCDKNPGEGLYTQTTRDGTETSRLGNYTTAVDDGDVATKGTPLRDFALMSLGPQERIGYRTTIAQGARLKGVLNTDAVRALPKSTVICKNGARTGVRCGPLLTADDYQFTARIPSIEGDSGGPVFLVNTKGEAVGIGLNKGYQTGDPSVSVMTYLAPAIDQLNVRVVIE